MKNKLIVVVILFAALSTKAQVYINGTKEDAERHMQRESKTRQRMSDNHIHTLKTFFYKPDTVNAKQNYLSSEYSYDDKGFMTGYSEYKKNGKLKKHFTNKWNDAGKILEYAEYRPNGSVRVRLKYDYDAAGNKTDERLFWNGAIFSLGEKLRWHNVSSYDEKKNILEQKYFAGNDDSKLFNRYVYSYYADGSRKQTIEYNGKNKVKHIWNFDCNPAGIPEEKNLKDTSNICFRFETDKDGNKIKVKEENVKYKKVVRIIYRYDKNENLIDLAQYDARGRVRYHNVYTYNSENMMTEFAYYHRYKNEIKERIQYHYDSSGMITEQIAFKSSEIPDHVLKFNYAR